MRGTTNGNVRGNTRDRLARRRWLLRNWAADKMVRYAGRNGLSWLEHAVRCYRCGKLLVLEQITVDRIVPGCRGGRYTRDNIRPACMDCNRLTGSTIRSKRAA